jgi:glycine cleavage system regulatory protein
MKTSIVLTVIADDQPGIIQTVSETLQNHDGNWSQSSMSSLGGQFAGILLVSVPAEETDACLAELSGLESRGLKITARVCGDESPVTNASSFTLDLVGHDRPGIVHDITTVLASHQVSVHDLETVVESASMAGGELFKASAQLLVPEDTDVEALESELHDLANDLMVDIRFEK